jgi:hypothetical protein
MVLRKSTEVPTKYFVAVQGTATFNPDTIQATSLDFLFIFVNGIFVA